MSNEEDEQYTNEEYENLEDDKFNNNIPMDYINSFGIDGGNIGGWPQNPNAHDLEKTLYDLTSLYIFSKGWEIYDENGNKINNYNSLELFEYLTEHINISLNYFKIKGNNTYFDGGKIYIPLMKNLPLIFQELKEQCMPSIFFNNNMCNNLSYNNINNFDNNSNIQNDFNNFNLNNNFNCNLNNNMFNDNNINSNMNNLNNNNINSNMINLNNNNINSNMINLDNSNYNMNNLNNNIMNDEINLSMIKSYKNLKLNNQINNKEEKEDNKNNNLNIDNSKNNK